MTRGRMEEEKRHGMQTSVIDKTTGLTSSQPILAEGVMVILIEIVTYNTKEYHHGQDFCKALETMAPYQIPILTVLTRIMDPDLQLELKKQTVSKFLKREKAYEENLGKAYTLVWGHCTDFMQSCIKSSPSYKTINNSRDVV
eukprot:606342-Ditylum_brightwellii.AAC.1